MKVYSELWHIQNTFETSMTERFAKSSYLMHFSVATLKIFRYKNFLYFFLKETHSEKISYIFSKERFSYISGNRTLPPPPPQKKSLYCRKWNFFSLPQENVLFVRKGKPQKNFLYFLKRNLFLHFGNGNTNKILYISGNGTSFYFRELKP